MSNEKFTKGEWITSDDGNSVIIKGSGGRVGYPPVAGVIANLSDDEYIDNDNEHDAFLIAAAPDMYEMIKVMLEQFGNEEDCINEYDYIVIREAKKLLAKARGEQ